MTGELGDVVHIDVLGQHIVVLNSSQACEDLLVKRGSTYSDRPAFTMANLCAALCHSFFSTCRF